MSDRRWRTDAGLQRNNWQLRSPPNNNAKNCYSFIFISFYDKIGQDRGCLKVEKHTFVLIHINIYSLSSQQLLKWSDQNSFPQGCVNLCRAGKVQRELWWEVCGWVGGRYKSQLGWLFVIIRRGWPLITQSSHCHRLQSSAWSRYPTSQPWTNRR